MKLLFYSILFSVNRNLSSFHEAWNPLREKSYKGTFPVKRVLLRAEEGAFVLLLCLLLRNL